ncbi:hypothetical protein [Rhodococcus sp. IEGM 1379]|uniref:hypothetical protein n=1 Tax=Rhodococcus sp. IEGM 1379 TaxID=3047086 RepID=UPI0024B69F0E|nr:hypothetical protein [Rhodococcus sp. IEGM 1379]MDI9914397.1 hypothetical protein [Rhodococcus sp. IEGM 1379]
MKIKGPKESRFDYNSDATLGFVPPTDAVMSAKAARTVAVNAHDVDDARQLLLMLGLIEPEAV